MHKKTGLSVSPFFYEYLDDPCRRYRQQHSYYTAEITEYTYRKKHEQRVKTCRRSYDFRIDIIAVYLLHAQESENRDYSLPQAVVVRATKKAGTIPKKGPK